MASHPYEVAGKVALKKPLTPGAEPHLSRSPTMKFGDGAALGGVIVTSKRATLNPSNGHGAAAASKPEAPRTGSVFHMQKEILQDQRSIQADLVDTLAKIEHSVEEQQASTAAIQVALEESLARFEATLEAERKANAEYIAEQKRSTEAFMQRQLQAHEDMLRRQQTEHAAAMKRQQLQNRKQEQAHQRFLAEQRDQTQALMRENREFITEQRLYAKDKRKEERTGTGFGLIMTIVVMGITFAIFGKTEVGYEIYLAVLGPMAAFLAFQTAMGRQFYRPLSNCVDKAMVIICKKKIKDSFKYEHSPARIGNTAEVVQDFHLDSHRNSSQVIHTDLDNPLEDEESVLEEALTHLETKKREDHSVEIGDVLADPEPKQVVLEVTPSLPGSVALDSVSPNMASALAPTKACAAVPNLASAAISLPEISRPSASVDANAAASPPSLSLQMPLFSPRLSPTVGAVVPCNGAAEAAAGHHKPLLLSKSLDPIPQTQLAIDIRPVKPADTTTPAVKGSVAKAKVILV